MNPKIMGPAGTDLGMHYEIDGAWGGEGGA